MTPTAIPGPDYAFWLNLAVVLLLAVVGAAVGLVLKKLDGIGEDVKELRAESGDHAQRLARGDEKFEGIERWKGDWEQRLREVERAVPARRAG